MLRSQLYFNFLCKITTRFINRDFYKKIFSDFAYNFELSHKIQQKKPDLFSPAFIMQKLKQ